MSVGFAATVDFGGESKKEGGLAVIDGLELGVCVLFIVTFVAFVADTWIGYDVVFLILCDVVALRLGLSLPFLDGRKMLLLLLLLLELMQMVWCVMVLQYHL